MNASLKLVSTNGQPSTALSNTLLATRISQFAANINASCYWQLLDIALFDTRRAWAEQGSNSCAHWLNWNIGLNLGVAREKIRVAHALADLPEISSAFRRGKLSYSKVRAMTRAAHCQTWHRQPHRKTDPAISVANRRPDYYWDEQGNLIFQGCLPAESGALFLKALNATVELLEKEQPNVPAETSEPEAEEVDPKELRTNQRADALVRMAESQFTQLESDSTTADRYQVVIHAAVPGSASLWA